MRTNREIIWRNDEVVWFVIAMEKKVFDFAKQENLHRVRVGYVCSHFCSRSGRLCRQRCKKSNRITHRVLFFSSRRTRCVLLNLLIFARTKKNLAQCLESNLRWVILQLQTHSNLDFRDCREWKLKRKQNECELPISNSLCWGWIRKISCERLTRNDKN